MATVYCAAIECRHNKDNRCKAKSINLSEGHIHTVHQGFKQVWTCRAFEMSDFAKRIEAEYAKITGGG